MTDDHGAPRSLPPSMRNRVPFLLYRTAEASHRLANQMLSEVGLTARQVGILTLISERGPMTQKALGGELQIDRTTMVEFIDDLEGKGLARRRRHPGDRRAFLIDPTDRGRDMQRQAVAILDRQQAEFLDPLSEEERVLLGDLLDRVYAARQVKEAAGQDRRS